MGRIKLAGWLALGIGPLVAVGLLASAFSRDAVLAAPPASPPVPQAAADSELSGLRLAQAEDDLAGDRDPAETAFPPGDAEEPEPAEEPPGNWMQWVDQEFGRIVVDPLARFLFYDFHTERWLGYSVPFVVLWLLLGAIYFTLRMGFINFRAFKHAVLLTAGKYDDPGKPGEVSHFQALASALSATVGLGNIAGVAIAVSIGGPGAIFWLIVAGLLGMSSKFTECTLGQIYRKVDPDGTVSGGPMHYLRDGLAELKLGPVGAVLAVLFSLMCMGGSFGGGCAFQVGQSLGQVRTQVQLLDDYPWIYGLVMAVLVGIVIIGGIRRIASTASKIVPIMCCVYVAMALYILLTHADQVLPAFGKIIQGAFNPAAAYGGVIGVMVVGIQRAAFSNEAGIGSASIAHSAARTDEPVSEGIVALLEPFIDTVVVCTMTGLVIVITGVYDAPETAELVAARDGAALTAAAVASVVGWFTWIVSASVVLFAYSTMISWSYYGERCWSYLFGPRASLAYKILFLAFVLLGSVVTAQNILAFSDLMILSMGLPNILGLFLLSGKVRQSLDAYWKKYQAGELNAK